MNLFFKCQGMRVCGLMRIRRKCEPVVSFNSGIKDGQEVNKCQDEEKTSENGVMEGGKDGILYMIWKKEKM